MSPLASYLEDKGITQRQFRLELSKLRGVPIDQPRISEWCRRHAPSPYNRHLIEILTEGKVPSGAWETWRRKMKK
jgi:hypothetical protein